MKFWIWEFPLLLNCSIQSLPQYIADSLCWSAIGARTSESQTHRQMASGLSMPVGFKNATAGDLKAAVNGIIAATNEPDLFGDYGRWTSLRGDYRGKPGLPTHPSWGNEWPQLSAEHVQAAEDALRSANAPVSIMVDCSHANSEKDPCSTTHCT